MQSSLTNRPAAAVFRLWLGLSVLFAIGSTGFALEIEPVYVDAAGQSWTAERRAVVEQAIAEWEAVILEPRTVRVRFTFAEGDNSWAGLASSIISYNLEQVGKPLKPWTEGFQHTLLVNTRNITGTPTLWFDPTPATGQDVPEFSLDALTIIRHELGHILGFREGYTDEVVVDENFFPISVDSWTSRVTGDVFDPDGLAVPMQPADPVHIFHSVETRHYLMSAFHRLGERNAISDTEIAMLALAHGYQVAQPTATLYSAWANQIRLDRSLTAAALADPFADDDADGTVNLLEFAERSQGLDPLISDAAGLAQPELLLHSDGTRGVRFTTDPRQRLITTRLMVTEDFEDWFEVGNAGSPERYRTSPTEISAHAAEATWEWVVPEETPGQVFFQIAVAHQP